MARFKPVVQFGKGKFVYLNDFNLDSKIHYLNCAYMGPQLKSVTEAGVKAVAMKERPWNVSTKEFFEPIEVLRGLAGDLMDASGENMALIPSASYGLASAASMVTLKPGDQVLVLDEQFPSNVYVWQDLCDKTGADLIFVKRPTDFNWTDAVLAHASSRVRVVAIPPCHWTDGSRLDLKIIRNHFPPDQTHLIVDASQFLGGDRFSVKESHPDVVVSVGYKWLLGPYSLGVMYVADRLLNQRPIEHNWINRAGSEKFSDLVEYESQFAKGARRFDVGEKSNFILVPMLTEALRWLLKIGCANIAEHNQKLLSALEDELSGSQIKLVAEKFRSKHMSGVFLPKEKIDAVADDLVKNNIYVSRRGACLRVSPNIYNDFEDIKLLASVLRK